MKRLLALTMVIVMMLTLTISASAATFVPSITNKGAPQLVVIDQLDGKDVVGYITDADGNQLSTEYLECLTITSLTEALNDPTVPDSIKDELIKVYEELNKSTTNIKKVCPAIDAIVKEKWGSDKSADDLVVKDLFDITDKCDDLKVHLVNGAILDLTFDLGIGQNVFFTAMVYVDGKWQPVYDAINNGDGTVTVKFDKLCPVAFLVPSTQLNSDKVSPTTGDYTTVAIWGAVLVLSLISITGLLIYRRKRFN